MLANAMPFSEFKLVRPTFDELYFLAICMVVDSAKSDACLRSHAKDEPEIKLAAIKSVFNFFIYVPFFSLETNG